MAATEALALNCKDNRIIKDAVKSTQERVVLTEIFLLLRRIAVAGEDHVVITVLLVTAVHHVKEQLRVLLAKFAVSHFINNKAGRPDKRCKERALTASPSGIRHPVTQLGHLNEVCLHAMLTTGTAKKPVPNGFCRFPVFQ